MDEEELFCKLFPEYVVNGKSLSPYFDLFESGYEQSENRIEELESECRRCVHTDCPCVLSDYGKDRNGICDHFKDVFDENIELKEEGKKSFNDWLDACDKYGKVNLKLEQAKEIIRKFLLWENGWHKKSESKYELLKQAEIFLKE